MTISDTDDGMNEAAAVDLVMQRLNAEPPKRPASKEQSQPDATAPELEGGDDADAADENPAAEDEDLDITALEDDAEEAKKAQPGKAEKQPAQVAQPQAQAQSVEAQHLVSQLTRERNALAYSPLVAQGSNPEFWIKLAEEDPLEYPKLKSQYDLAVMRLHQYDQAIGNVSGALEGQLLQQEYAKVVHAFPEFKDPKAYGEFAKSAVSFLHGVGFQTHEIDALTDHRAIKLIRMAMKYDAAVKGRQALKDKEVRPQATPVLRPQAKAAANSESENVKLLKAKALKSGKDGDRMDAVLAALGKR